MTESPEVSQRVREIDPDKLDFGASEAGSRFDFDAKDRRRYQRAMLEVPIAIALLAEDGQEICRGKAILCDLSLDGALLTGIEIDETEGKVDADKLGAFTRIQFTVLDGPFKGMDAAATPIRVGSIRGGVGVKLEKGFNFRID